jgi:hypothetical protein
MKKIVPLMENNTGNKLGEVELVIKKVSNGGATVFYIGWYNKNKKFVIVNSYHCYEPARKWFFVIKRVWYQEVG